MSKNGAINWRVIGDFWAWVLTGRQLGRNLRAEYERRIADLQTENDQNQIVARMIFEQHQEIAQLWRRKVNAQEESIDQLREEQDRLREQVDAYRQEIDRLQIELEMYRQIVSEKEAS